nr:uncharacterized protein LOC112769176 [Arachis hypogaea]
MTGERDVKRSALPKANADSKSVFMIHRVSGLSLLVNSIVSLFDYIFEVIVGGSLHRDHIAEQKVVAKGSNRSNNQEDFPASISNTLIKNKVSRAPRTGSVSALDLSNVQSSSENFPGSSIHPMTQWVGQRPPKIHAQEE